MLPEWDALAAPLRGVKAVSYHQDLVYFARRFGLELLGTIEDRPGIPATPGHVEELVERMRREKARLVIREVFYELPLARRIADQTGARLAAFSPQAGGMRGSDGYVESIEANLRSLVTALGAPES
jgi:ABC-type Zn uptake system ZnuABC Zn-binding protein ZnuA